MSIALRRHDALIASEAERTGGVLVKSKGEGDSCFLVFSTAGAAVDAAVQIQRAISREAWPRTSAIRIRIALHTGEAELRDDDYFGPTVNRCARLRAIAWGGQILMSQATAQLVTDGLRTDPWLRDLGIHGLKDLGRPERVYQLCHSDLDIEFPALRSLDRAANNLPSHLPTFVGRDSEMAQLKEWLEQGGLVTIAGAGGSGKTRLALQAAADCADLHPDGVWFVDFSQLQHAHTLWDSVLSVLRCQRRPQVPLEEQVLEYLSSRTTLLILDNCEHVLRGCAPLAATMLHRCPGVTVLATSRERLGVPGECVLGLQPLSLPHRSERTVEGLLHSEAVRLFVDRAGASRPGFALDAENGACIAEICSRLDGLPLAIELAAARTRLLSPQRIAERLAESCALLGSGPRTAPARQQTLRAAIEWSFDLLDADERDLLERMAVFSGSFSFEAVHALLPGSDEGEVVDVLARLVDKSLVVVDSPDRARYRLLQTIREHALERLNASSNEVHVRQAHERYFVGLAIRAGAGVWGPEQSSWLDILDADRDNVRVALSNLAERTGGAGLLEPVTALGRYWTLRDLHDEAEAWLSQALDACSDDRPELVARALYHYGTVLLGSNLDAAKEVFDRELAIAEQLRDGAAIARALVDLGRVSFRKRRSAEAIELAQRALACARGVDDRAYRGALALFAEASQDLGRMEEAEHAAAEAVQLARSVGDARLIVWSLTSLARIASARGRRHVARSLGLEALSLASHLRLRSDVLMLLTNLGLNAECGGDLAEARRHYREAIELADELGSLSAKHVLVTNLGAACHAVGDLAEARRLYEHALTLAQERGDLRLVLHLWVELGRLALDEGDVDRAELVLCEALERVRSADDGRGIVSALSLLARTEVDAGRVDAAGAHCEEAGKRAASMDDGAYLLEVQRALASIERAAGRFEKARDSCQQALDRALDIDEPLQVSQILIDLAQIDYSLGSHTVALSHLARAEGLRSRMGASPTPRERVAMETLVPNLAAALGADEVGRVLGADLAAAVLSSA